MGNPQLAWATRRGLVPRDVCEICGVVTPRGRRYCSRACYAKGKLEPIEGRFWKKVQKAEGCWEWRGGKDVDGYGTIILSGPRTSCTRRLAHRLSWEMHNGPIPAAMQVCHRCDNPGCVRPDHLFLGTAQENQYDKVAKGRQARGERVGRSKLTDVQVMELRRRFAAGPTNDCHLAREFGVRSAAIRFLRIGKTWRHLPGGPSKPPPLLRVGRPRS